jgi:23S rRNA (guanosine2251-2'-O)-methyltransferase
MGEWLWISGLIAVEAVLEANSREVKAIYTTRDRFDSGIARLNRLARERNVPIEAQREAFIDSVAEAKGHGGVAAQVGPRRMTPLTDLAPAPEAVVVMLDGVEDPFNFGQAVRSLYAAGIDGVVVRLRNWLSVGTAVRASAGATELMPMAEADSVEAAAAHFRARGFRVAVATERRSHPMTELNLRGPLFLVVGGEKRGVTRSFESAADLRVGIAYGRSFPHALGTAAATTALAFEIHRQRHSAV